MQAGSAIAAAVGSSVYSVIIRLGLRIKQEGWSLRSPSGRIRNVQKFYAAYYHFWLHGGVWGACVHQFGVVGKYLILVGAVVFLLFSVNWDAVMKCKTADDCDHATLVNAPTLAHLSLLQSLLGVAFTSVFLMTACYEVAQLCKQIIQLNEVHDSLDPFFLLPEKSPVHKHQPRDVLRLVRSTAAESARRFLGLDDPTESRAAERAREGDDDGSEDDNDPAAADSQDDDDDDGYVNMMRQHGKAAAASTTAAATRDQAASRREPRTGARSPPSSPPPLALRLEGVSRLRFDGMSWQCFLTVVCHKVFSSQDDDETTGGSHHNPPATTFKKPHRRPFRSNNHNNSDDNDDEEMQAATTTMDDFASPAADASPPIATISPATVTSLLLRSENYLIALHAAGYFSSAEKQRRSAFPASEEQPQGRRQRPTGSHSGDDEDADRNSLDGDVEGNFLSHLQQQGGLANPQGGSQTTYLAMADETLLQTILASNFHPHTGCVVTTREAFDALSKNLWFAKTLYRMVLVYPFFASFVVIKWLIRTLATARVSPAALASYQLKPSAKWALRLFNEPQHVWEHRMTLVTKELADLMELSTRPPLYASLVARLAQVIVLLGAVLLLFNPLLMTAGSFMGASIVLWLWLAALLFQIFDPAKATADRESTHRSPKMLLRCLHTMCASLSAFYEPSVEAFQARLCEEAVHMRVTAILGQFVTAISAPYVAYALLNTDKGRREIKQLNKAILEMSVPRYDSAMSSDLSGRSGSRSARRRGKGAVLSSSSASRGRAQLRGGGAFQVCMYADFATQLYESMWQTTASPFVPVTAGPPEGQPPPPSLFAPEGSEYSIGGGVGAAASRHVSDVMMDGNMTGGEDDHHAAAAAASQSSGPSDSVPFVAPLRLPKNAPIAAAPPRLATPRLGATMHQRNAILSHLGAAPKAAAAGGDKPAANESIPGVKVVTSSAVAASEAPPSDGGVDPALPLPRGKIQLLPHVAPLPAASSTTAGARHDSSDTPPAAAAQKGPPAHMPPPEAESAPRPASPTAAMDHAMRLCAAVFEATDHPTTGIADWVLAMPVLVSQHAPLVPRGGADEDGAHDHGGEARAGNPVNDDMPFIRARQIKDYLEHRAQLSLAAFLVLHKDWRLRMVRSAAALAASCVPLAPVDPAAPIPPRARSFSPTGKDDEDGATAAHAGEPQNESGTPAPSAIWHPEASARELLRMGTTSTEPPLPPTGPEPSDETNHRPRRGAPATFIINMMGSTNAPRRNLPSGGETNAASSIYLRRPEEIEIAQAIQRHRQWPSLLALLLHRRCEFVTQLCTGHQEDVVELSETIEGWSPAFMSDHLLHEGYDEMEGTRPNNHRAALPRHRLANRMSFAAPLTARVLIDEREALENDETEAPASWGRPNGDGGTQPAHPCGAARDGDAFVALQQKTMQFRVTPVEQLRVFIRNVLLAPCPEAADGPSSVMLVDAVHEVLSLSRSSREDAGAHASARSCTDDHITPTASSMPHSHRPGAVPAGPAAAAGLAPAPVVPESADPTSRRGDDSTPPVLAGHNAVCPPAYAVPAPPARPVLRSAVVPRLPFRLIPGRPVTPVVTQPQGGAGAGSTMDSTTMRTAQCRSRLSAWGFPLSGGTGPLRPSQAVAAPWGGAFNAAASTPPAAVASTMSRTMTSESLAGGNSFLSARSHYASSSGALDEAGRSSP